MVNHFLFDNCNRMVWVLVQIAMLPLAYWCRKASHHEALLCWLMKALYHSQTKPVHQHRLPCSSLSFISSFISCNISNSLRCQESCQEEQVISDTSPQKMHEFTVYPHNFLDETLSFHFSCKLCRWKSVIWREAASTQHGAAQASSSSHLSRHTSRRNAKSTATRFDSALQQDSCHASP